MKVLTQLTASGGIDVASTAVDTIKLGSANTENNDAAVDNLTVWANADFKNNVTLGSSSADIILAKAPISASSGISSSLFVGDGSGLTLLTASNITNFTTDVKRQISAGTGIVINSGQISASAIPNASLVNSTTTLGSTTLTLGTTTTTVAGLTSLSSAVVSSSAGISSSLGILNDLSVTRNLTVSGNAILGDATADSITLNANTISLNGALNIDSNTLYVDATNNRVGIVNNSPTVPLDVKGAASVSGNMSLSSAGALFRAYNEDSKTVKFANWYAAQTDQWGQGQLFYELWFGAINTSDASNIRRIGFYTSLPDNGTNNTLTTNADMYIKPSGVEVKNNLTVSGNVILGNATTDTVTLNANTLSLNGALNIDSNTLYVDATNNEVGIGTNNPATQLDVRGTGSFFSIKFPANQSASSDANTLDDYEEGTWTPALFGSTTSSFSYQANGQVGNYTKIGREVTLTGYIFLSSTGSSAGNLRIGGLPFTSIAGTAVGGAFTSAPTGLNSSIVSQPIGNVLPSNTLITLYKGAAGGSTVMNVTDLTNTAIIPFGAVYYTT